MQVFTLLCFFSSVTFASDVEFKKLPPKAIYQECQNCHRTKSISDVPRKRQPLREHSQIQLKHGNKEMSCNHCHDKAKHNFLREKVSFQSPSKVCFQCHSDILKSWEKGLHGKRVGGWKGARTQYHCTECHNPHSVVFPQWKAEPAPARPKYSIPKSEKH